MPFCKLINGFALTLLVSLCACSDERAIDDTREPDGGSGVVRLDGASGGAEAAVVDASPLADSSGMGEGDGGGGAKLDGPMVNDGPVVDPPDQGIPDSFVVDAGMARCGNGRRDQKEEECDDGNQINLDGCSSDCLFEHVQRVNALTLKSTTDNVCTANAFGASIVNSLALTLLQSQIDQSLADGSTSLMLQLLDLDDLGGDSDPQLDLGVLVGTPVVGGKQPYNGARDLDWWYTTDGQLIDAQRRPLAKLAAKIASRQLTAGPGELSLRINLGGSVTDVLLSSVLIQVPIDAVTSRPKVSQTGDSPGHQPVSQIDPTLTTFDSMGKGGVEGRLCGRLSAASIETVTVPSILSTFCSNGYTGSNSLLDVIVGGCNTLLGPAVRATQPDSENPDQPAVGKGPGYTLTVDAKTKQVNGCRDKSGATVNLDACLKDASYSVFFGFGSNRVIAR